MTTLTDEQIRELLKPIDPNRVGRDGKGYSHVEAWDVRRTMNAIFGFGGWSADVSEMEQVCERQVKTKKGLDAWNVIYRARCTIRIMDVMGESATYTEWAGGQSLNPDLGDAHDHAMKTAQSQAFKRCCVNLGDQFGLSLYKDGSMDATVQEIVGMAYADSDKVPDLVEAFNTVETEQDLADVAQQIPPLDISESEKILLRAAYQSAKQRLDASRPENVGV